MSNIIAVKFKDSFVYKGREYLYKSDEIVQVGDEVIVNTSSKSLDLEIALVTRVDINIGEDYERELNLDYIIQVVNKKRYLDRKTRKEKIKKLKNSMDARVQNIQESSIYEALAKEDDVFRELYLEYKQELEKL